MSVAQHYLDHIAEVLDQEPTIPIRLISETTGYSTEKLGYIIDYLIREHGGTPAATRWGWLTKIAPATTVTEDEAAWFTDRLSQAWPHLIKQATARDLLGTEDSRYLLATHLYARIHRCGNFRTWMDNYPSRQVAFAEETLEQWCGEKHSLTGEDWVQVLGNALFGPAWTALYLPEAVHCADYYRLIWQARPPFRPELLNNPAAPYAPHALPTTWEV